MRPRTMTRSLLARVGRFILTVSLCLGFVSCEMFTSTWHFSVTYDGNGATSGTVPVDSASYLSGDNAIVRGNTGSLVKTGAAFSGWNSKSDGTGITYPAQSALVVGSASVTLYAIWNPITTYTITYNANGGTGAPTDTTAYQTGATATVMGPGSLARSGYTFGGWNTTSGGTGITYPAQSALIIGSGSVTLYAIWTPVTTYTITYDANGGTGAPTDTTAYQTGATATVMGPGILARNGYTFGGWNTTSGGTGITYPAQSALIIGSGPVTLFAIWNPITTYAVTYNANGATGGTVPVDSNSYQSGVTATVLGNSGILVNGVLTFSGWNTLANGTGTTYSAQSALVLGTTSVTLYAIWK